MNLRLVDPIAKIEKDIQVALVKDLNIYLNKKKGVAADKLKQASKSWVFSQLEMQSLQDSSIPYSLSSLFGLPKGSESSAVSAVADAVANSIEVKFSKIDKNFKGGLTFSIQPADFKNLLGLPEGHVTTKKGVDLHWLSWLLEAGDSVIIAGYQYDASGRGRSGAGTMVTGSSFRVPPSYSGTMTNNFVTRAFENKQKEIEKIISEVFK
jgi:hypothetical protein